MQEEARNSDMESFTLMSFRISTEDFRRLKQVKKESRMSMTQLLRSSIKLLYALYERNLDLSTVLSNDWAVDAMVDVANSAIIAAEKEKAAVGSKINMRIKKNMELV